MAKPPQPQPQEQPQQPPTGPGIVTIPDQGTTSPPASVSKFAVVARLRIGPTIEGAWAAVERLVAHLDTAAFHSGGAAAVRLYLGLVPFATTDEQAAEALRAELVARYTHSERGPHKPGQLKVHLETFRPSAGVGTVADVWQALGGQAFEQGADYAVLCHTARAAFTDPAWANHLLDEGAELARALAASLGEADLAPALAGFGCVALLSDDRPRDRFDLVLPRAHFEALGRSVLPAAWVLRPGLLPAEMGVAAVARGPSPRPQRRPAASTRPAARRHPGCRGCWAMGQCWRAARRWAGPPVETPPCAAAVQRLQSWNSGAGPGSARSHRPPGHRPGAAPGRSRTPAQADARDRQPRKPAAAQAPCAGAGPAPPASIPGHIVPGSAAPSAQRVREPESFLPVTRHQAPSDRRNALNCDVAVKTGDAPTRGALKTWAILDSNQ